MANNFYKILIYLHHHMLQDIFSKNDSKKAKINIWLNQFNKFDLQLIYQSLKDYQMGLVNSLNQILIKPINKLRVKNLSKQLVISNTIFLKI